MESTKQMFFQWKVANTKIKVVRVLVEGPSKKNKEVLSGRTSTNKIVLFKGDMALKGQFVDVKINECKTWTLYGDIV